jgi:lysophospholipase L1-like esterase
MKGISFIVLCCLFHVILCGTTIQPNDPNIHYSGRFTSNYEYEWSGVYITAAFTGTSIQVLLKDGGNMFNVFIDGQFVYWLNCSSSIQSYPVASGLPAGKHEIQITKRTEASFGPGTFVGFELDDGASLVPLSTPLPTRKIEVIGDSITCGYGDLGTYPCSFSATTEDNYLSYGPVTARALNAEIHVEAWSGMGMVRNYGDKNTTSAVPFPLLFPYILPSSKEGQWNFSQWIPDVVIINLGTNDYSTQPYPPQNIYRNAYVDFITTYTKLYFGHPKFFLICGPMQNPSSCPNVQIVANTTGATYIDLLNILDFPADYGCDYHPAVTGHAKMANLTIAAIQSVMGW